MQGAGDLRRRRRFGARPTALHQWQDGEGADAFSAVQTVYEEDGARVGRLRDDFYSSDYFAERLVGYLKERPRDPLKGMKRPRARRRLSSAETAFLKFLSKKPRKRKA